MQDTYQAVLVRALELVLLSRELTTDDKRYVSSLLDSEIASVIATGETDALEMAKLAVKEAVKKRRKLQGVATRTAAKREESRRELRSVLGR
jgi:hypothetical protein